MVGHVEAEQQELFLNGGVEVQDHGAVTGDLEIVGAIFGVPGGGKLHRGRDFFGRPERLVVPDFCAPALFLFRRSFTGNSGAVSCFVRNHGGAGQGLGLLPAFDPVEQGVGHGIAGQIGHRQHGFIFRDSHRIIFPEHPVACRYLGWAGLQIADAHKIQQKRVVGGQDGQPVIDLHRGFQVVIVHPGVFITVDRRVHGALTADG